MTAGDIHITFNLSGGGILRQIRKRQLPADVIVDLGDDWSVGPITHFNDSKRRAWFNDRNFEDYLFYEEGLAHERQQFDVVTNTDNRRVLWYSRRNLHDYCGYLACLSHLDSSENIFVVDLTDDFFPIEGKSNRGKFQRIFGPGHIAPELLAPFLERAEPLDILSYRSDLSLWRRLQDDGAALRAFINGSLSSVQDSFYDGAIIRRMTRDWQTGLRVAAGAFMDELIYDEGYWMTPSHEFLSWRLRELAVSGHCVLRTIGKLRHPAEYLSVTEVRLP